MARRIPKFSRLNFKRLLYCFLFLFGCGGVLWVVHFFADQPTKDRIEGFTLDAMDVMRESSFTPKEMVWLLDQVADAVPLTVGRITDASAYLKDNAYVLGGLPESPARPLVRLKNDAYLVGYDEERRNPAWVAFRLPEPKFAEAAPRPESFSEDRRLRARVEHRDFSGSGYDRGHLAPNHAVALCFGPAAQEQTFLLSNICPQFPAFNQVTWKSLEDRVFNRYVRRYHEVWCVVGPVFEQPATAKHLRGGIVVPDAFYAILADRWDDPQASLRTLSFLIPHRDVAEEDLSRFIVSIETLERKTGLNFFPGLPVATQKAIEEKPAPRLW